MHDDTTPATYGWLTAARFTAEAANRKGAPGDQTTPNLLHPRGLNWGNPIGSAVKEQGRKPGLPDGSVFAHQKRYTSAVETRLPSGLRPCSIPPLGQARGLLERF